jgi:hypothetical protein
MNTQVPADKMLGTATPQLVLQQIQTTLETEERIQGNKLHQLWTRKEKERNLPP